MCPNIPTAAPSDRARAPYFIFSRNYKGIYWTNLSDNVKK